MMKSGNCTRYMKHFTNPVSGTVAPLRANSGLYLTVVFLLVISVAFFVLGVSSPTSSFANKINALSYSLGLQVGKNLNANNININMSMFLRGLDDGRHGKSSILTNRQANQADEIVMMIMQCQATAGNAGFQFDDEFMVDSFSRDKEIVYQGIFKY